MASSLTEHISNLETIKDRLKDIAKTFRSCQLRIIKKQISDGYEKLQIDLVRLEGKIREEELNNLVRSSRKIYCELAELIQFHKKKSR